MSNAILSISFAGPHVSVQDGGRPGMFWGHRVCFDAAPGRTGRSPLPLRILRTCNGEVNRVKRFGGGDEKPVAAWTAKGHVGDRLRHSDLAQKRALR